MIPGESFPVRGVVGIVGGPEDEVRRQVACLEGTGPGGVEVRADLFPARADALSVIGRLRDRLPVLFTVRREAEGGAYRGAESDRIEMYEEALRRGAVLVDAELGSDAARVLARRGAPLLLSHHDFDAMIGDAELAKLTKEGESLSPLGIKIVPVATRPVDGLRMLEWVAGEDGAARRPRRVGFAMGERGVFSRILAPAWGAPITYGSLTAERIAPGQLAARELIEVYRAPTLTRRARIYGVIGSPVHHSLSPHMHNAALAARGIDAVYLPLELERFSDLADIAGALGIAGVSVTIPFKQDAYAHAAVTDAVSEHSGATNTLVWERTAGGDTRVRGWNTDGDGVLEPLARRRIQLPGLSVGILGNGGAARGAAGALLAAGSRVTLYYRNKEKGEPVARALGCGARAIEAVRPGDHALLVNATPLGLRPGDPSPVSSAVFGPETAAFDMIYDPPETPFLREAAQAGVRILIPGREMLICQGLVQFRLFTGQEATYEEFEEAFLTAQRNRGNR